MKKVRIGVIGAGKMAFWHLRAYEKIPSAEIIAIANPDSDRGKKLAKKYNIPKHYSDGFELIEQEDIDAVDLCIPSNLHKKFILKALNKGLHVYSEKPLCLSRKDYEEVITANKKAGKVIFNGFNYRFFPEFRKVCSIVKSGKLGTIKYTRIFRTTKERPDSYIFNQHNYGIINEFHCHFIDLLYYFGFGDPKMVFASGTTVHKWNLNPDTATVMLMYSNNAVAEITTSLASPGIAPEVLMIGSKGTLVLKYGVVRIIPKKDVWSLGQLVMLLFKETITMPFRVLRNTLNDSCDHFVSCVLHKKKSECSEFAALQTFIVSDAATQSYFDKQPVKLKV